MHEGVHVEDHEKCINTIQMTPYAFDRNLNISGRQSEINAYGVENEWRELNGLPPININDVPPSSARSRSHPVRLTSPSRLLEAFTTQLSRPQAYIRMPCSSRKASLRLSLTCPRNAAYPVGSRWLHYWQVVAILSHNSLEEARVKGSVSKCAKCGASLSPREIRSAGVFACPRCHAALQARRSYGDCISAANVAISATALTLMGFSGTHLLYAVILAWFPVEVVLMTSLKYVIPPKIEAGEPRRPLREVVREIRGSTELNLRDRKP